MNSKEFIQAIAEKKDLRYKSILPTVSIVFSSTGKMTYLDLEHSVFVTIDSFDTATGNEVTGFIDGVPMMTLKTDNWEVVE